MKYQIKIGKTVHISGLSEGDGHCTVLGTADETLTVPPMADHRTLERAFRYAERHSTAIGIPLCRQCGRTAADGAETTDDDGVTIEVKEGAGDTRIARDRNGIPVAWCRYIGHMANGYYIRTVGDRLLAKLPLSAGIEGIDAALRAYAAHRDDPRMTIASDPEDGVTYPAVHVGAIGRGDQLEICGGNGDPVTLIVCEVHAESRPPRVFFYTGPDTVGRYDYVEAIRATVPGEKGWVIADAIIS